MAYPYNNYGNYNPYFNQPNNLYQQPMQPPIQPTINQNSVNSALQGKVVDSVDVVKATEIPYDYSISYFPLTDGTAIITKQLMKDGTSKMLIYKPVENEDSLKELKVEKYLTEKDLNEKLKEIKVNDFSSDIKAIKKQIRDLTDDIEEIKNGKD